MTGRTAALALVIWMVASSGHAGSYRLDDSLTHTVPANVQMQWRPFVRGERDSGMEAWVRVNVRIDTREWVGRSGQVYLVLDRDDTSAMEAEWTTEGRLLPGRIRSGERTLVYSGTLTTATLEDQFVMRLRSLSDWRGNTRRLNFHFEFDTP
jgi:hypothetical protein